MNTIFMKIIGSPADSYYAYEFKKRLQESGWLEKIHRMYDSMDLHVLQKIWTSVLFRLPMTVVTVGHLNDKDCEIISDFCEIDSLMRIIGAYDNTDLWIDPFSCELSLSPNNGKHVLLNHVYDTFELVGYLKEYEQSDASDTDKKIVYDNLTRINSLMQQYPVSFRNIEIPAVNRQELIDCLKTFYKEHDNVTI